MSICTNVSHFYFILPFNAKIYIFLMFLSFECSQLTCRFTNVILGNKYYIPLNHRCLLLTRNLYIIFLICTQDKICTGEGKLKRAKNTAPGDDGIEYRYLRALDPKGQLM